MKRDYIVELREEEADELMNEHWVGELVYCKDCKYWNETLSQGRLCKKHYGLRPDGDWFCADGEREG